MYNSKLIKILSVFQQEEVAKMNLFAKSNLFNDGKRPQKTQALLHYLSQFHPDYDQEGLEKTNTYSAIFSGEKFNEKKLTKLSSELIQVVRKFIEVQQKDMYSEYNYWLKQAQFFQERKLDNEFQYAMGRLQKQQQSVSFKEQSYFFRQFRYEREKTNFNFRVSDKKTDANVAQVIYSLDVFYIISKMEYCSYLLAIGTNINLESDHSMVLLKEVMNLAKDHYLHIPIISAYYYTINLLMNWHEEEGIEYELLKRSLNENSNEISHATLRTMHSYMRNYLTDRYNRGDSSKLTDLFELFKDQIRQGTIYQDGHHILGSTLQNAITIAIKLEEYHWAMDFLTKHKNRINGADDPKSLFEFNLANIYFHEGLYDLCLENLNKYHYREAFYNLASKRLEVKLYYEMKISLDVLESKLKAFKSFIYEHKKLLKYDKFEPNNNFIKLLFQIFNIIKNPDISTAKIEKLKNKLEREQMTAEREWLSAKLNLLLKASAKK